MLKHIIAFSLKNAALVIFAALLLLAATWYALDKMPVDVFPELNAPTVTLITESSGLTAEEVENYISFPIESAVNGLSGLRRVRSASSLGLSIVWAEFDWGVDIYRARQMVSERIESVQEQIPADSHMQMTPISSITGEIMLISLRSDDSAISPMDVRAYAEFDLRNRLLTVNGVSEVVAIGGHLPEYQIEVQQERLQLYELTTEEVASAISKAHNLNSAGFLVNVQGLELPLRQSGRVRGIADIQQTVVAHHDGAPITVADVATVQLGGAFRRGAAADNGQAAVVVSIQKAPSTNTLELTERVDALLDQIEPGLPSGLVLNRHVFRQSDFINRSVNNVTSVLYEATVIVSVVLMLFLMNIRTTIITLTALPVSLGTGLLVMWMADMSINVMTLGGLAVAIGILVDDAIIDVENVFRRLGENAGQPPDKQKGRMRIIFDASNEIRSSIVFATIIICIVFVPLLFLGGLEGRFFKPLALTYIISVMASLVVALTVTPALCWYLLRGKFANAHTDAQLVTLLKKLYRPLLGLCTQWKKATLTVAGMLTLLTIWCASSFGSSFLPAFNEGTYTVFLMMPPGTSLEESERIGQSVQTRLLEIDGIEHVVSRSGRAERDEHAEPPSSTEAEVRLAENADTEAVLAEIDALLAGLPGVTVAIGQPISHRLSHVMSGTKAQIAISVFGEDLNKLRQIAKDIQTELHNIPGTRDVNANREVLVETLAIDFRLADLARYGLSAEDAGAQVRRSVFGETVTVVNQGVKRYDVTLRLDQDQRSTVDDIHNVVLTGSEGALVRLHEVANIGPEQASNLISRENAQRKTIVSANVAEGYNLGDTVAAIQTAVNPIVFQAGYTVHYGGQFEAQQSASKTIISIGAFVLVLMIMLLHMALGSLRPALLVMANIPLALIGGVAAMFLAESDAPFDNLLALFGFGGRYIAPVISIASLVGFITLFGIAVRNGILLVNHFSWLTRCEGISFEEAVHRGSEERLVPVLMTAISAALGLIPLALKMGEPGSELLAPLAIVILGGLLTSTLLNMLIVPAGYLLFCKQAHNTTSNTTADELGDY